MTVSNSDRIVCRSRSAASHRRHFWKGHGLERRLARRQRPVGRIAADEIVWPSGEGHEIGIIDGNLEQIIGTVRRRVQRGVVREPVSYGEDGAARALVLGQPRKQTLACLVADETQAPGVVAVIADARADPVAVIRAVEKTLGRGFEVRAHAA